MLTNLLTLASLAAVSGFTSHSHSFTPLSISKTPPSSSSVVVTPTTLFEDFGFFKGTSIGFEDIWGDNPVISEVGIENEQNANGLRYKMNKTAKERDSISSPSPFLSALPSITLNLPFIGETYIGPPKVDSVWEALGFTATSNNEARQAAKIAAVEKARGAKSGVLNGEGASLRAKWLQKYGYPRLVGSGGIFYADQLSTDKEPMGGFNMGKSGVMFPVPEVVERGTYGGVKGWGMKKKGTAVDGLPKVVDKQ